MPTASIAVTYEPPKHGWVKVRVTIADQELEIDASDVPNNPVQEMAIAVRETSEGRNAPVWWYLEPA